MSRMLLSMNPINKYVTNIANTVVSSVNQQGWFFEQLTWRDPLTVNSGLTTRSTNVPAAINASSAITPANNSNTELFIRSWRNVLEIINRSTVPLQMTFYKVISRDYQMEGPIQTLNQAFWYSQGAINESGVAATVPVLPNVPANLLTNTNMTLFDAPLFLTKYKILKIEKHFLGAGQRIVKTTVHKNKVIDMKPYNDVTVTGAGPTVTANLIARGQTFWMWNFKSQLLSDSTHRLGFPTTEIAVDARVTIDYHRLNVDQPSYTNTLGYTAAWAAPTVADIPLLHAGWNIDRKGDAVYPESM